MIRAVLDTNVYVSALLRPLSVPAAIVKAWRNGHFQLVLSPSIQEEIARVLEYPHIRKLSGITDTQVAALLLSLRKKAFFTQDRMQVDVIQDDPSDNKFVACALEGNAGYIVTGDRHLLQLQSYRKINILTPRQFLDILK